VDNSPGWISAEVAEGPLKGKTLHQLVGQFGNELMGDIPLVGNGQFPLLIKFLDAREDLSVQVHPDEAYARANPGAHLKNEAWYIVQADPGSRLLKGLKPGVTREAFAKSIADGSVESTIHSITVKPGDCFYLPSGTVHALGAGILAAEVQTPSDTTYRVFDFNRVDPSTGKPRTLHIDQAMKCIDFSAKEPKPHAEPELVKCDHFTIAKVTTKKGTKQTVTGGEPIVLMLIHGQGGVAGAGHTMQFALGDTILLPASLSETSVFADAEMLWLEVKLKTK
jgi:mannose-6-phosphate isomerase